MSTLECPVRTPGQPGGHRPDAVLDRLEADAALFEPEKFAQRMMALDELDRWFGDPDVPPVRVAESLRRRAQVLINRIEEINRVHCQPIRSEIAGGAYPGRLLDCLRDLAGGAEFSDPAPGPGFDARDELVSDLLQLREPCQPDLPRSREMVGYQPTPVRHILDLAGSGLVSREDTFVDLGSGLGHVPLLVSLLTGVESVGIEIQPAYVSSARECARTLGLTGVRFLRADARHADLSTGTVFYLYSPFQGSILRDVLTRLRKQSTGRSFRVCSLGPVTHVIRGEAWLRLRTPPDPGRITVFTC